jgi:polar amino acid transport system substrate-binding protein
MRKCAIDAGSAFRLRQWLRALQVLVAALPLTACEDFPRDPGHTLEQVRNGELRVGVRESEPWAMRNDNIVSGVEAGLVQKLARRLNAKIRWVAPGPGRAEPFDALYRGQLDLVIGGITQDNPWSGRVTFTRPYLTSATVIASKWTLTSVEGERVLVDPAFPHMQKLMDLGAVPVFEKRGLAADPQLQVKPFWALSASESVITTLVEDRHVFALPPGENAWLVYVDGFLQSHRDAAWRGLRETAE